MNELTKEEIKNISKKISDIYQKVFGNENNIGNIEWIKSDLNILCKQLKDIKINLENQLTILYDNGSNEIDPEVNQLRRQIQEIDNLEEDIIPDLLFGIQDSYIRKNSEDVTFKEEKKHELEETKSQDIKENIVAIEIEEKAEEQKNETQENFEQENEIIIESNEVEQEIPEIIEVNDVVDNIPENIVQENEEMIEVAKEIEEISEIKVEKEENSEPETKEVPKVIVDEVVEVKQPIKTLVQEECTVLPEKQEIVTIKLSRPSNDYKYIAENIVNVRNCSLPEPSKAIEEGAVASEQVIENIKNILMKDI